MPHARRDKIEIRLHLIWKTFDKAPLITPVWEDKLYYLLRGRIQHCGCFPIASGGVADHVHLLLGIRSTTRVCELVKDLKGNSAGLGKEFCEGFKWRPTYAAYSVSLWDVDMIENYLLNQKAHHAQKTTDDQLEAADEKYWYDDAK